MTISKNTRASLMAKPHVHMVWTAKDGTVKVGVDEKVPLSMLRGVDVVPSLVQDEEGKLVKTDVVPVGKIVARSFTDARRPCPGGWSCGHAKITAGTLGLWVRKNGGWYILSNNHVLANSNEGVAGDTITQPGPYDLDGLTTDPSNWIGRLHSFVTINSEGDGGTMPPGCSNIPWPPGGSDKGQANAIEQPFPNLVDCALAEEFGGHHDPGIENLARPTSMRDVVLGEMLTKSGRTTETTQDPVEANDLAVEVQYGSFTALFEDQLLVVSSGTPFSQGGDSGSAVLAKSDGALVGLLFAGGQMQDGTDVTIVNKIAHVQGFLGFEL